MGILELAVAALIIALVAGAMGFTGIARGAASVSRLMFGLFLVVAIALFALVALGIGVVADEAVMSPVLPMLLGG